MLWPANSPDLNPFEHILSILKDLLNKRPRKPTSKEEMIDAINEEWEKIPPHIIATLVGFMNTS